ncbi:topoisomerase [Clostridium sp. 'deep sea']|uniref:topoisomerase n=1 Tax=Clostridium sp. 'deep sea' TaxID=2779445 RepID=UPI00189671FF|nr:topoisomerase [Clostridium sp. 'deep sea']QOR36876.1 topoisomerase [Clostridium sp. 'deep sea']
MAKKDRRKTIRNKRIKEITDELNEIVDQVLEITGYNNKLSLNAKIGGKHADFYDVRHEVIKTPEQYISLWLDGLMHYLDNCCSKEQSNNYKLLKYMQNNKVVMNYVTLFLERTFLRKYEQLSKVRPRPEEATIWIGQENANYGLLVSPRFRDGAWENDGSEIRKFKANYFTIGHILETGLVIPQEDDKITFDNVEYYMNFFKNVLVRSSGSKYEKNIAKLYCELVENSENPKDVPLLIPEFRYGGIERRHRYRLDFTVINPYTLDKYGFELSPWSSHGYLGGIKGKTQKQVNEEAKKNFEKEMRKHKDYYRKYGVYSFIYTDSDLKEIEIVFNDIKKYLEPPKMHIQLKLHTLDEFYNYN